ncbi:nuclear transport factor 2 family protein [Luteolibacter algae]|uniref:Nuclear transport factor 2 family protein n=1 Tax=Luteolibacter algae TaxID=454151 RepID=A0ABW5D5S1_9BACT
MLRYKMPLKILIQLIPWLLVLLLALVIILPACSSKPDTVKRVNEYRNALSGTDGNLLPGGNPLEKEAIGKFTEFLQRIGDKKFIEENTARVYASDAYLNDTIVTHHGPDEIKAYFLETSETMDTYEVTIEDIASSGAEHYVRWTMVFSAPRLNGGKPVHSLGMSHVRFNPEGQVTMHQDFWDSGTNIYGQIPVLGGAIESIRRRFEK